MVNEVWVLVFAVTQPWATLGGVFDSQEKCADRLVEIQDLMVEHGFADDLPRGFCVNRDVE